MKGRVYGEGETDGNHWKAEGEADLALSFDAVNYRFTTCSTLDNRIPDVIAAPAGLCSLVMRGRRAINITEGARTAASKADGKAN